MASLQAAKSVAPLAMSVALRWGLGLASVSLAFVLAQTFVFYHLPQPFTAFSLSAIAGTFWYGGTKPGIFTALISWLVRDYLFEPEVSAESRILYGLVFLVFALVMTLVTRGRNKLEARAAEEGIRESEYKLRQIIETVPAFLWSTGPDGEPTHINQRILDYSGMRFEDFKHRGWEPFLHPEDFPETVKAFVYAIETGTSYDAVHRLRRSDGEYRWYRTRGEPLRDPQGQIVQWYGLSIDIDEAKKAEDRLRRSETNLTEAQRLSRTGSWALNPATRKILYWSEECYRIWGFDPAQGLPYRAIVFQRIHPDDRDRVYKETQEALQQKRDYKVDFRIVLRDGTVKHLETIGHHLLSAHGELAQVVGTNIDVTESKRAEQALRKREAKIRRLVDANVIGITITDFDDLEGRIVEANDAFLRMIGYDRAALISGHLRWMDLTPTEWHDVTLRGLAELRRTGSFQPYEKEYLRKDGARVPVLVGGAAFGEPLEQSVAFVLDLTERKRAEEALRESEAKFRDYAETASDWF